MCGISGILKLNGEKVSEAEITNLNNAVSHRGPDGFGVWHERNVALGHRRLAIIDLTTGAQPMWNIEKTIGITFNGEIYNYLTLRAELEAQGYKFATNSDTEVIINAYAHWGDSCVKHLRGMFAFAIVDLNRKRLFIARDHLGIKPLVYYHDDSVFAFASEIQALSQIPGVNLDKDLQAIDQYLWLQYIPAPRTIYKHMHKLAPGHYMSVTFAGEVSKPEKYWQIEFKPDNRKSEADWIAELEQMLLDSVKGHMIADVPLGAFLSGGLDSSAVVAMMAQLSDRPIKTFCIGFEDQNYNESAFTDIVAKRWHTDHHCEILQADALSILPAIVRHYGEPFGDSSAIPTYYVSQMTRQHVTVALSGDGGDELFAGYDSYKAWAGLQNQTPKWRKLLHMSQNSTLANWLKLVNYIPADFRIKLWRPEYQTLTQMPLELFEAEFRKTQSYDEVTKAQYMDINTYMPFDILTKVDIASMMHALEVRTPLIDVNVMEFVATMPSSFKLKQNGESFESKAILKKLLEKYYDKQFIYRKKQGFALPVNQWLKQGSQKSNHIRDRLLASDANINTYFQSSVVEELLNNKGAGGAVWLLLCLEEWLAQNEN